MQKGKTINLQDTFLTRLRQSQTEATVYLVNGYQMRGIVTTFDAFTVCLLSNRKYSLIYKHAISTIVPATSILSLEEKEE